VRAASIDPHIATGRHKHEQTIETVSEPPPVQATAKKAMRHKLCTKAGRSIYKMRKAIVESTAGTLMDMDFAVLCQLVRRRMPYIRFLFIGSRLCSALPSAPPRDDALALRDHFCSIRM